MNVVIVESPAKAKTINKYLGRDYKVVASYGGQDRSPHGTPARGQCLFREPKA